MGGTVLLAAGLTTVAAVPVVPTASPALELHWLDPAASEARCLDGSRYGYYFRAATTAATANKWVIELQGGGWCYNEGSCYGRTLPSYGGGVFGSSLAWPAQQQPYFSDVDAADWNRVFLRYCSGASFTGYRKDGWDASGYPVVPGHPGKAVPANTTLWFRGAANVADTIAALQRDRVMTAVDELVVQGSSAGGLATTLNVDRIAALTHATRVAGLSDAGFFKYESNHSTAGWDGSANFSADMRYVNGMFNSSGVLSPACRAAQTTMPGAGPVPAVGGTQRPVGGEWNCLVAATAAQYVQAPIFYLQSKFDHFQLGAELGLPCMVQQSYTPPWKLNVSCPAGDISAMKAYGADLAAEAARVLAAPSARRGVYLSACIVHGQTAGAWDTTKVNGVTPQQAWTAWYSALHTGGAVDAKWVEDCDLPCNPSPACAPYR